MRPTKLLLFVSFVLPLLGRGAFSQDDEKLRTEFRNAVQEKNASRVEDSAKALARTDKREAVDTLLWGYGQFAGQIQQLWQEKLKHLQTMDANEKWKIENNQIKDPDSIERYKRFMEAQTKAQEVNKQIMELERCKRGIVTALALFGSDKAVDGLIGQLKSDPSWEKRAGIAEALGKINNPKALPALIEQFKKEREPGVKVAIVDAIRDKKKYDAEVISALSEFVKDPKAKDYWQVMYSVVLTLRDSGSKDAIEPLITAMGNVDGRMRYEIMDALIALTGVDKGLSPEAWKNWWDQNKESVSGGSYKPRPEEKPAAQGGGGTTFYGIPVKSKNIIFVLDRSGSMAEPSEWEEDGPTIETGGPKGGPKIELKGKRKIDVARFQLKRVLAQLPKGTRFNILYYNQGFEMMSQSMLTLNDGTRHQAFSYIDSVEPEGGTNIFDPLEKALQFAEVGADGKLKKDSVDTIYLLSDGLPNSGQIPDPGQIRQRVQELNKVKKVSINTIFVGNKAAPDFDQGSDFMKSLASENNGQFAGTKK